MKSVEFQKLLNFKHDNKALLYFFKNKNKGASFLALNFINIMTIQMVLLVSIQHNADYVVKYITIIFKGGFYMAFFDELGKKISQTSQGVAQKTKDTAKIMKLNGLISDEEKRINAFYSQMGKTYFELHCESYEQNFESMVIGIKEAQAKIEEHSEQIKKLKGIDHCPNCGRDVQYGATFCSSCGSKIETKNNTVSVNNDNMRRCLKCGMPINDGCVFCTHCGTKTIQSQKSKNEINFSFESANKCPNCNNEVSVDSDCCVSCGTKLNN